MEIIDRSTCDDLYSVPQETVSRNDDKLCTRSMLLYTSHPIIFDPEQTVCTKSTWYFVEHGYNII